MIFLIPSPLMQVYALQWSPTGRVLATWEQYATTAGQEAKPNLHLWDAKERKQKHYSITFFFNFRKKVEFA
jgi:hypothetical protein